jgi:hypothetical protein
MEFYFEDDHVELKGLTTKGKNRIREHGSRWVIRRVKNTDIILQAWSDQYLKWNYASEPDFEIVKKLQGG